MTDKDDVSMLSPDVREAYETLDAEVAPAGRASYEAYRAWCTIHAELLRLIRENDSLRERIAGAPLGVVNRCALNSAPEYNIMSPGSPLDGKRVRLVVD